MAQSRCFDRTAGCFIVNDSGVARLKRMGAGSFVRLATIRRVMSNQVSRRAAMFKAFEDNPELPPTPWSGPDRERIRHSQKRLFVLMAVAAGLLTGLCAVGTVFYLG